MLFIAARKRKRNHADTVFIALKIALTIKGLQRVAGVIFERAKESRKAELLVIGMIEEIAHEIEGILVQHFALVIAFGDQIIEFFTQIVKEHRVLVDVLKEILLRGLTVAFKLDFAFIVIKVQHRIKRVIIEPGFRQLCCLACCRRRWLLLFR